MENAMKIRSLVAASNIGLMCLLTVGIAAEAAELKVLSAAATRTVMEDLGPKFERATGHKLAITFATVGVIVKRIQGGETGDLVIVTPPAIESLAKDGKVVAGTGAVIASSGVGLAVRKGALKPDISSPEALKRTLLAAKSISYTNPALGSASSIHFTKVLDRLGIAEEMKPKTIFPIKPGEGGLLVANGEAEIAVDQLQVFVPVAGIEILGPLPGDLQDTIVFSAAIMTSAKDTEAGKTLIKFLRTPEAAATIKAKGMEPATP
jgi:molybdate transport system substrate-binding protein